MANFSEDEFLNLLLDQYGIPMDSNFSMEQNFSSVMNGLSPLPPQEKGLPTSSKYSVPTIPSELNISIDELGHCYPHSPLTTNSFEIDHDPMQATDGPSRMTNDQLPFMSTLNRTTLPTYDISSSAPVDQQVVFGSTNPILSTQQILPPSRVGSLLASPSSYQQQNLSIDQQISPPIVNAWSPPPATLQNKRYSQATYFDFQKQSRNSRFSNFLNHNPTSGLGQTNAFNLMEQNWEAFTAFLSRHVRPGPDVPHVYKCSICTAEFPNAQALGGHKRTHSKMKKADNSVAITLSNKSKRDGCGNNNTTSLDKNWEASVLPINTSDKEDNNKDKNKNKRLKLD